VIAALADLLLPLAAGAVVLLGAVAFALYLWTWVRYVALPGGAGRAPGEAPRPCSGRPLTA
jgi:hypothetical protein